MKPLVIVDSVLEDGTCDFCAKPVGIVLSCTFGTGEQMCLCRADFFKMVRVRTRTNGRGQADAVSQENGDPITTNAERF